MIHAAERPSHLDYSAILPKRPLPVPRQYLWAPQNAIPIDAALSISENSPKSLD
jgi:hypothetical protein